MSNNFHLVQWILQVNLMIAGLYLLVRLLQKDYKKGLMMSLFIALVPVIGALYLFVSWLIYVLYFKRRKSDLNLEELSLSKDRIEVIEKGNMAVALNTVPIGEALLVSDIKDTRKLLLDILKNNTKGYSGVINQATSHKDTEVSHYAAAAITDIMDQFKKEEKVLRTSYMEDKKDPKLALAYETYLSDFLKAKILAPPEQKRYLGFYEDLLIEIEKTMPELMRGKTYYKLVLMLIDLGDRQKAQAWFERAMKNKPEDLASYKAGFQFYYAYSEGEKLLALIRELMDSSIRIDKETLEFIRFYN